MREGFLIRDNEIRMIVETGSTGEQNEKHRGKGKRDPRTETGFAIEKDLLKRKEEEEKTLGAGVGPVYKKRPCMATIVEVLRREA
jgi:hypothetical protein